MALNQIISKRVKEEMEANGISPEMLSEKTGLKLSIVQKMLSEKCDRVRAYLYVPICKVLEVSMDYILGLSDEKKTKRN